MNQSVRFQLNKNLTLGDEKKLNAITAFDRDMKTTEIPFVSFDAAPWSYNIFVQTQVALAKAPSHYEMLNSMLWSLYIQIVQIEFYWPF